jgi:hypothetical protein
MENLFFSVLTILMLIYAFDQTFNLGILDKVIKDEN